MKKLFLAALSLLAVNAMNAQTTEVEKSKTEYTKTRGEGIEARVQRDVDALDKQLTFTPEQKQKAHDIILTKMNKQVEVRSKYTNREDATTADQRKADLNAIKEEYKTSMKGILTPSQIEKFNTINNQIK